MGAVELSFGFDVAGPIAPRGAGFQKEPFDDWWSRVEAQMTHVPVEVAREWVHRHWTGGPISSRVDLRAVQFVLEQWSAMQLAEIGRSDHWARDDSRWTVRDWEKQNGFVARFMLQTGEWPSPIIVGRRLSAFPKLASSFSRGLPSKPILLEGHVRFEVWRSLSAERRALRPVLPVWVVDPSGS